MRVARHIRRLSTSVTLTVAALTILGSGIAAAQTPGADVMPRGGPTMSSADDVACLQLPEARTDGECPCFVPGTPAEFLPTAELFPTAPLPADVDVNSVPAQTIIVRGDCR
jgi:hypothetical protein